MGKIVKIMAMGVGAVGVFGGSVAVFLMSRGDLNQEGLSQVPVIGSFFQVPELAEGGGTGGESASSEGAGVTGEDAGSSGDTSSGASDGTGGSTDDGTASLDIPELFDEADIASLLTELRATRSVYQNKLAAVAATGQKQEIEAREMRDRKQHIEKMLEDIQLAQDELARERARIEQDVVRYEASEVENIKALAKLQENADPVKVAETILEMLDGGDDTGIKILSEMSDRKAGKVISEFAKEDAARVVLKMTQLAKSSAQDGQE